MSNIYSALVVSLVLVNLFLLGSSRLGACIRVIAIQGVIVSLLTAFEESADLSVMAMVVLACALSIKGLLLPRLMLKAIANTGIRREVEPYVSYCASILFGIVAFAGALWLVSRLPVPAHGAYRLAAAAAAATSMIGLFLIVTRKKAISQVVGYLAFENGIYAFGAALLVKHHLLVELGVLLDVFVLVFIMGIMVFHINSEFDHIDINRLNSLSDHDDLPEEEPQL